VFTIVDTNSLNIFYFILFFMQDYPRPLIVDANSLIFF
jgi:hypothetical protein